MNSKVTLNSIWSEFSNKIITIRLNSLRSLSTVPDEFFI